MNVTELIGQQAIQMTGMGEEIRRQQAQIQQLTRERDQARKDLADLKESLAKSQEDAPKAEQPAYVHGDPALDGTRDV